MRHVETSSAGTLVMVRTTCCETYKSTGSRCSICPNRLENRENVRRYLQELSSKPLGRRTALPPFDPGAEAPSASHQPAL